MYTSYRRYFLFSKSLHFGLASLGFLVLSIYLYHLSPVVPVEPLLGISGNRIPLSFVPNVGQTDEDVQFLLHHFSTIMQFKPDSISWSLSTPHSEAGDQPARVTAKWSHPAGMEREPVVKGGESLPGSAHYLLGDTPSQWINNLPTYESLTYEQLYPGINLFYKGHQNLFGDWELKSTYAIAPGTDPGQIEWSYQGATDVQLRKDTGNLLISISLPGQDEAALLVEHAPEIWQELGGQRRKVAGHFLVDDEKVIHFAIGDYDPTQPLFIEPTLSFSTYLGGSVNDYGNSVAVDEQGNIYIAGWSESIDFPTTPDAFQPTSTGGTCISPPPFNIPFPCNDGFVTKLSSDGSTILYSTYLGGTMDDGLRAIVLDENGDMYLTGWTTSLDFPTVNPIQPSIGGGANRTPDAFIAKLSADGSALLYSTYLGGGGRDYGDNLAIDSSGNAYIIGWTESTDFPTANAIQGVYGGGFFDGFVAKINAAGNAYVYSTFLGGNDLEYAFGIDADDTGHAYVTGFTLSNNFPISNAFQPVFGGGIEAYVTKLLPDGSAYVFSTYFGSNDTRGFDIRVNDSGSIYLVGLTSSPGFPVVNPLQGTYSGTPYDAFVTRFVPDGSALDFSTYLGGDGNDVIHTLALDGSDNVFFTGWSTSSDFPLSNPVQTMHAGGNDVIIGMISSDLSALDFSTYLGGTANDLSYGIVPDGMGNILVAGYTESADFPVLNPLQPALSGDYDSILVKINLNLPGIPQAGFTSSSPDLLGDTTVFTNTSTGPNLSFEWDLGDGSPVITDTNPIHTYANPGVYTVTLTATNDMGNHIASGTVEILLAPQAGFLSSSPDALGVATVFTNTSSGSDLSYLWDFGDESPVITDTNPIHTYDIPGFYTVALTTMNLVGSDVATGTVEILVGPQAGFFSSSPDVLGNTTVFTNTSIGSNLSFEWDFGDGSPIETTTNPAHIYANPGMYMVTLTAVNEVGSQATTSTVEILLAPQAGFTSSSPDILGETTVFTNTSSGSNLSFEWDFGDGSPVVTTTHPIHTYENPGLYSVTLTVTNEIGSDVISGTIEITNTRHIYIPIIFR